MDEKRVTKSIRIFCLFLTLTLIGITSFSAYAEDKPTIKLKYGSYAPRNIMDEPILWYLSEVSKRSGIKIEVETYFAGTLAKPPDCLGAIGVGIYDIGWISPVFTPTKTPLAIIPNATPLVSVPLKTSLRAANEYTKTFPPAALEFKKSNVKCLFHSGVWYYDLMSIKPVKSYEDIKGLRVRTYGYLAKVWSELGGMPISISIPEVYSSLQKGVLDAVLTQPAAYKSLHLSDVAKHFTKINFGCLSVPVVLNLKTWNKLPKQVQKAMNDLAHEMPAIADEMISSSELEVIASMEKEGISINKLPATDIARNRNVSKMVTKIIVDDLTSKGITTAGEAMGIYLKAIEKYKN